MAKPFLGRVSFRRRVQEGARGGAKPLAGEVRASNNPVSVLGNNKRNMKGLTND